MTLPLPARAVRLLRKPKYQAFLRDELFVREDERQAFSAARLEPDLYRRVSEGLQTFTLELSQSGASRRAIRVEQYIAPGALQRLIAAKDAEITAFLDQDAPGWQAALATAGQSAQLTCAVAALEAVAPDELRQLPLTDKQRLMLFIEPA